MGFYANPLVFGVLAPTHLDRARGPAAPRPPDAYRVVLVSIDGLGADLVEGDPPPTLARLAREGLRAARAETVLPSITLPSHTSMISGVTPDRHGVRWNDYEPWRRIEATTIFSVCRREGLRCGLFAAKPKFAHLVEYEPGVERYEQSSDAADVFAAALSFAEERDPDFLMVHVGEVDWSGHDEGWGSSAQRQALAYVDLMLGRFLAALRTQGTGRLALLLTADHGGHGSGHGGDRPEDLRIPWILWGDGIPAGGVAETVSTIDTGPTILALLGVDAPRRWQGTARFHPPAPPD